MKRDPDNATEPVEVPSTELSDADTRFLDDLGAHVRNLRERRGMSRRLLARESRVSERYLAKLEAGAGNMSVVLLRRVAGALGVPLGVLLGYEADDDALRQATRTLLERVPLHRLEDVIA